MHGHEVSACTQAASTHPSMYASNATVLLSPSTCSAPFGSQSGEQLDAYNTAVEERQAMMAGDTPSTTGADPPRGLGPVGLAGRGGDPSPQTLCPAEPLHTAGWSTEVDDSFGLDDSLGGAGETILHFFLKGGGEILAAWANIAGDGRQMESAPSGSLH